MAHEGLPVIRLELEGVRRQIAHMLQDSNGELAEFTKQKLAEVLTTANIEAQVQALAKQEIERAVRSAVEQYFRWGDGQKTLRAVIDATLNDAFSK